MQYDKSQKEIKKIINGMAGKYNRYNIFRDFIVLSACTISNHSDMSQWEQREKMYMETIAKYDKEEANKFAEMLALMIVAYDRRMGDFIGELYMSMEFGNKHAGQFFTPYDISKMMATFVKPQEKEGIVKLNEPACGSGGMIVAYAETLKEQGYNYQTKLRVVCNDIDYDVVKMAYIQLSLLGIDAIVMQGNTIAYEFNEFWYTPMHILNLAREKQTQSSKRAERMIRAMKDLESPEKELVSVSPPGQTNIFDYLGDD